MEIPFICKNLNCYERIVNTAFRMESSVDCVVPDVQEDIQHILSASFTAKIRSKDTDYENVSVKAELAATVLYSSDKGIEKLEAVLPLNADIPAADADSSCSTTVDLIIDSYEVKTINPRKISVSAIVIAEVKCYKNRDIALYEVPEELPDKLFVNSITQNALTIDTVGEKTFILEEEFDTEHGDKVQLMSCSSTFLSDGYEAVGERIVVRGHAAIECVYICDGRLKFRSFNAPFSQLFDTGSECIADIDVHILSTGEYYEIADDRMIAEIHAVIQLAVYAKSEIRYASDAYSCTNELEIGYEKLEIADGCESSRYEGSVQLTYDAGEELAEIQYCTAYCGVPKLSDGSTVIPVSANIIYKTANGELSARKLHGTASVSVENAGVPESMKALVYDTAVSINGSIVDFRGTVKLTAVYEHRSGIDIIRELNLGIEMPQNRPAAYLVRQTDEIWELAKKYKSDPELICSINNLSDDLNKKLLLIPRV